MPAINQTSINGLPEALDSKAAATAVNDLAETVSDLATNVYDKNYVDTALAAVPTTTAVVDALATKQPLHTLLTSIANLSAFAKGTIITGSGVSGTAVTSLVAGSNGLPLVTASATASGLKYAALTVAGGGTGLTVYSGVGRLLYSASTTTTGQLTPGAAGTILQSAGTTSVPAYVANTVGDFTAKRRSLIASPQTSAANNTPLAVVWGTTGADLVQVGSSTTAAAATSITAVTAGSYRITVCVPVSCGGTDPLLVVPGV